MTWGITSSYFFFMVSLSMLFLVRYRKAKRKEMADQKKKPIRKRKR